MAQQASEHGQLLSNLMYFARTLRAERSDASGGEVVAWAEAIPTAVTIATNILNRGVTFTALSLREID